MNKYIVKYENGYNSRNDVADTLVEARLIARHAVSSALGEPARVGIYRNLPPDPLATPDLLEIPECIELWEDGRRIWKGWTPGAELRALRPVLSYICAHCGRGFTASDTRARYCSNRCRQAEKYARKIETRKT